MLGYFLNTLITALSLLVADLLIPGIYLNNFPAALIAGAAIGVVNALIRPVVAFLSLPINFLTLGLFALVVNGLCFWLASLFTPGFQVSGPLGFLLGPVVLSVASTFLNNYFAEKDLLPGRTPGSSLESGDRA